MTSFGMQIKERSWVADGYRYGFNGMEKDDQVKGDGNSLDFGARIYDSRLGKFLTLDPAKSEYPSWSNYTYVLCNPVLFIDFNGEKPKVTVSHSKDGKEVTITITNTMYVYNKGKKAQGRTLDISEVNKYLKGGTVMVGDKKVNIVFDNNIVTVKNKREAKKKIKENDGYGLIVENGSRDGRAYHSQRRRFDIIRLGNGPYHSEQILSHEVGHDLGFADKYVDVEGVSVPFEQFTNSLMGVAQPINDFELTIIAVDVLHGGSLDKKAQTPVDHDADRVAAGTKLTVQPWDFRNNKPDGATFDVEILPGGGSPVGKKVETNVGTGASTSTEFDDSMIKTISEIKGL